MKKLLVFLLSAAFSLAILFLGLTLAALWWYDQPGPLKLATTLIIEPGTGFNRIAQQLEQAGVIEHEMLFRAVNLAKGTHRHYKAGEYSFAPNIRPADVADRLIRGESITHAVTIPEGKTSREIIALLMADARLSGLPPASIPEGSLLPDTHHVHRGESREALVRRMQQAQQEMMAALWPVRQSGLPLATPQEAIILASIVEKETGLDGERGQVAAVFVNRLRRGMPLQSDPTVVYAIERKKGPLLRPLYRSDWKFDDPYNTYQHTGLPPGPICHPGHAAIEAVLNPPPSSALFFVATGNGGHYFAETLREHNRNIQRYKQNRSQAGE